MKRHDTTAVVSACVAAVGSALMLHEWAHVIAGRLAGGTPTLWTALEVRGRFETLTPGGFAALGSSGLVMNLALAAIGWTGLRRFRSRPGLRLAAWFVFAVNGMIVATKTMLEPLLGWGDWMSILRPFESNTPARIAVALLGTLAVVFMVRRSGAALAWVVPAGDDAERVREARRILAIGAASAAILVAGAGVASPLGATRGLLLGAGAGVGPFVPLWFGTRFAARTPAGDARAAAGGMPGILVAGVTALVTWCVGGPGVRL